MLLINLFILIYYLIMAQATINYIQFLKVIFVYLTWNLPLPEHNLKESIHLRPLL